MFTVVVHTVLGEHADFRVHSFGPGKHEQRISPSAFFLVALV